MKLQSYIEALLDQWTRGLLDPEDFVRQVREAVIEEAYIEKQRAGLDGVGGSFDPMAPEAPVIIVAGKEKES